MIEAFSEQFRKDMKNYSGKDEPEKTVKFFNRYFADKNAMTEDAASLCAKVNVHLTDRELKSMCRSMIRFAQYQDFQKNIGKKPAPVFSAVDVYNQPLSLERFKGKYVLLHFWSMYSRPSVDELSDLKKIYKKYGKKGLVIISINGDKLAGDLDKKTLLNFIKEMNLNWRHIADGNARNLFDIYFVHNYPTLYLLNREGYIVAREKDLRGEKLYTTIGRLNLSTKRSERQ